MMIDEWVEYLSNSRNGESDSLRAIYKDYKRIVELRKNSHDDLARISYVMVRSSFITEVIDKDVTLEVVTRKPAPEVSGAMIGAPLEKYRGAQPFEALRFATDKSDKKPVAYMVTYGNLAMCRARAQFACNFFAVAGFKVVDNNRFSSVAEGVEAALAAKADIIVACSSDEEYAEGVPQIAELVGNKAIVVVAGDPACKDELMAKGVENFISVKSNVLETLKGYQAKLGIK
jgi:methylmalonyl-CoA mutase